MKILVIYDSVYGNTEKVARAIGGAIASDVKVINAKEAKPSDMEGLDILIIGAPTQGGRPTQDMQNFLKDISKTDIKGLKFASFDTRISARWVGIFGYAAGRIAKNLRKKGADLIKDPEPFFVNGTEGPLKEGEIERAAAWAQEVVNTLK
jgi:flavodoxin I